jgi:hypothetical protein
MASVISGDYRPLSYCSSYRFAAAWWLRSDLDRARLEQMIASVSLCEFVGVTGCDGVGELNRQKRQERHVCWSETLSAMPSANSQNDRLWNRSAPTGGQFSISSHASDEVSRFSIVISDRSRVPRIMVLPGNFYSTALRTWIARSRSTPASPAILASSDRKK